MATPPLSRVLVDPTRRDFFNPKWKKLKNLVFLEKILEPKPKMAEPTRAEKN